MIKMSELGKPITETQIDALEKNIDAKVSDSYRRFLILNNGGKPAPDIVDVEGAPGSPTDVQVFFGIDRDIESSNISWNLALMADRCPGYRVLPIACDSGGNIFCLKVSGDVVSEVLYCDLDAAPCVFYPVALSFDEFVGKIRTWN